MPDALAARDRLIVALDLDEAAALSLAEKLRGRVRWLKVGMTLYYACGPTIVGRLRDAGFGVFLDLKLHDIPHQVHGAARAVSRLGVGMLTVHAGGGAPMVAEAVAGAAAGAADAGVDTPTVLAVTVLTSMDDATLASVGVPRPAAEQVPVLARLAVTSGAHGIVCSPHEAGAVRAVVGGGPAIVTPGVRPAWASADDQSRIATPAGAIRSGATHLVVGRPITSAADPVRAAESVITEIEEGVL